MANPFKQNMPVGNLSQFKNMLNMLNAAQNPQAALNMLAQKNPQVAQVMNIIGGRNPQQVFYELCREKGVNPDDILNQLK